MPDVPRASYPQHDRGAVHRFLTPREAPISTLSPISGGLGGRTRSPGWAACSPAEGAAAHPPRRPERRRSWEARRGWRWFRLARSSARLSPRRTSTHTSGPPPTSCGTAGSGSPWPTAGASRCRRWSCELGMTAITWSTGATECRSLGRSGSRISTAGSQAHDRRSGLLNPKAQAAVGVQDRDTVTRPR
jgi:hypothetical protein